MIQSFAACELTKHGHQPLDTPWPLILMMVVRCGTVYYGASTVRSAQRSGWLLPTICATLSVASAYTYIRVADKQTKVSSLVVDVESRSHDGKQMSKRCRRTPAPCVLHKRPQGLPSIFIRIFRICKGSTPARNSRTPHRARVQKACLMGTLPV